MSVRVMTAVWAIDLPDSQKIVLLALADSANDEGRCWPSMKTLAAKCSKGERTVQGVIKELVEAGHLSRAEVVGKGCNYTVHPRSDCAPQNAHPRREQQTPPQPLRTTPAAAADKPSLNRKEPSQPKTALPANWHPVEFDTKSKCRKIVAGWPPGELETQVEAFIACHTAKGSRFEDWQAAWRTWVLNWEKFGGNRGRQHSHTAKPTTRDIGERVAASFARASDRAVDLLPGPRAACGNE
jgi:hypothetical protein